MATFTISLVVGATTFTYTESPSNAAAARIGPAYRRMYGLAAEVTDQVVWEALGRGIANSIKSNVLAQEKLADEATFVPTPFE